MLIISNHPYAPDAVKKPWTFDRVFGTDITYILIRLEDDKETIRQTLLSFTKVVIY